MGQVRLNQRRNLWLARVFLLAAVLIVGVRSFGYNYVEFDDPNIVYENPHVRELSLAQLRWMFTDVSYNNHLYTPLLWLFYSLSGFLFGFAPQTQHVISVVLHGLNAWLVFEMLRVLCANSRQSLMDESKSVWPALIGALFWAVHPLRVETYAWIAARVHLHAAVFAFAACWIYFALRRDEDRRIPIMTCVRYWLAVACMGISILAFPVAVMLPVALGILDWYMLGSHAEKARLARLKAIVMELFPLALVVAIPVSVSMISKLSAEMSAPPLLPPIDAVSRLVAACYVAMHYVYATVAPLSLAPVYTRLFDVNLTSPVYVASTVLVIGISIFTFDRRKAWPVLWAGWLCYLVLLIPSMGPSGRPIFASDRYVYIPAVAGSVVVTWGLMKIWERWRALGRRIVVAMSACVLVVLAGASIVQVGIWRDSVTLFQTLMDRLGNHPYNADTAWRMAMHYLRNQETAAALEWLDRGWSIQQNPQLELAKIQVLARRCQLDQERGADRHQLASDYADLLNVCMKVRFKSNQAVALRTMDVAYPKLAAVIQDLKAQPHAGSSAGWPAIMKTYALSGYFVAAHFQQQGENQQAAGMFDRAFAACQESFAVDPDAEVGEALAMLYFRRGQLDEATAVLNKCIELAPDSPSMRLALAQVLYAQNRRAEADGVIAAVIQRWPEMKEHAEMIRNQSRRGPTAP